MITYGEFIDSIEKMAEEEGFIEGKTFLEEWKGLATEEQWKGYRQMEFGKGEVINLAEDMAHYYREVIDGTCGEELYHRRIKQGHAFLAGIHKKAIESGIEIKLEEVDKHLTVIETMASLGCIEMA